MFVDTCGVVFWVGQVARECVQRQLDIPFVPFLGNVLEKRGMFWLNHESAVDMPTIPPRKMSRRRGQLNWPGINGESIEPSIDASYNFFRGWGCRREMTGE